MRFNPSPLQSPDAICFKGTPNLLCICSGKSVWGWELTVQPPSEQAHKHKPSATIYPTNSEVWPSFTHFWSSLSWSTNWQEWMVYARNRYVFSQCLLDMEKEIHTEPKKQNIGIDAPAGIPISHILEYQSRHMCSQDDNNKTRVNILHSIAEWVLEAIYLSKKQARTTCFAIDTFNTKANSFKWVSLCFFYVQFSYSNCEEKVA